jgi:transposase-like protein
MTDSILSPQQLAVICALSNGASVTDAAAEAGVHRNTIANWRRNLLSFQNSLANAQYDRALFFREKMEELAGRAVETIQQILTDPKAPASVRLRAALAVMQVASTPPEPKKRTELEIKKVVVEQTQLEVHNDAQPEPASNPPNVHNSAQSPYRRETPGAPSGPGRNEPCPCGMPSGPGQKYKGCCFGKPHEHPPAAAA